jgi:hypothetical protein
VQAGADCVLGRKLQSSTSEKLAMLTLTMIGGSLRDRFWAAMRVETSGSGQAVESAWQRSRPGSGVDKAAGS